MCSIFWPTRYPNGKRSGGPASVFAMSRARRLPPRSSRRLKAAVEWVLEPDESKRRAAQAAGEAADFGTPAGCAALAVYGSGGSLGPDIFPDVPPGPYMTAQAVSGSITMASTAGEPGTMPDVCRELIMLGIAIAEEELPGRP